MSISVRTRIKSASLFLAIALILMFQGVQSRDASEETWQQNNSFVEYTYPKEGFAISLPKLWKVMVQPYGSEDIRFTVTYTAETPGVHGLVQVWRIPDLKGFIEQSIITAPSIDNVAYWPTKVNQFPGYFLSYRQITPSGKIYIREVFLESPPSVIRITLMVPEEQLSQEQDRLFKDIIYSLRKLN